MAKSQFQPGLFVSICPRHRLQRLDFMELPLIGGFILHCTLLLNSAARVKFAHIRPRNAGRARNGLSANGK